MSDITDEPINYHDDNRVLRYLLHSVKGISPVSGGVLSEVLEQEDVTVHHDVDYESANDI